MDLRQCQIAPVTVRQARSFVALLDAVTARAKMLFRVISGGALDTAAKPQQNLTSGHRPSGACRSEKERKEKIPRYAREKGLAQGFHEGLKLLMLLTPACAEFRLLPLPTSARRPSLTPAVPHLLVISRASTSSCALLTSYHHQAELSPESVLYKCDGGRMSIGT